MCIYESDTVKSDCPVQNFRKMMKCLKIQYKLLISLTSFTVCFGDIKKKEEKISSENDQVIFRTFLFFVPHTLNLKKKIPEMNL